MNPASRQPSADAASAYENVCAQCCQAKLDPSGAVRRSPSIHTPLGQLEQARSSVIQSVPSGVTTPLGVPLLNSATVPSASGGSPGRTAPSAITARSSRPASPPASSPSAFPSSAASAGATISTGRSRGPRRSASGANAEARDRTAGTHSRAPVPSATSAASCLATGGSAAARTSAVNAFSAGPPSAILKSGRLESTSTDP